MARRRTRTVARSSKTGRFVTKAYAKRRKATTEIQRVRIGRRRG